MTLDGSTEHPLDAAQVLPDLLDLLGDLEQEVMSSSWSQRK